MSLVIFLLSAAACFLALSWPRQPKSETVEDRLARLVKERKNLESFVSRDLMAPEEAEVEKQSRTSAREAVVEAVDRATRGMKLSQKLDIRLLRAGWKWRPAEFLVVQVVAAVLATVVGLLFARAAWWLFALLGLSVPYMLLVQAEKQRLKTFSQQLPDALAIMANALRSGYSFLQAMDVVGREMPEPINREFGYVLREARVNIPLEEALQNLVRRVPSPDLDLIVTAVVIQRQVGGNLAEVLDKIGGTIKDRIKLHGEIRTLSTQGRFSGWIVSLLPIVLALLLQLVSPGYLTPLFSHPIGWAMLLMGAAMQGIGIFAIKKMVNLEV